MDDTLSIHTCIKLSVDIFPGVDIILNSCTDSTFTASHLLKSGGHMINLDIFMKHMYTIGISDL